MRPGLVLVPVLIASLAGWLVAAGEPAWGEPATFSALIGQAAGLADQPALAIWAGHPDQTIDEGDSPSSTRDQGTASEAWGLAGPASPPLTVAEAVAQALAHHPRLEEARAGLAASRARVRQAQAAFWPSVVAAADYEEKDLPLSALGMGPLLRGPLTPPRLHSVVWRRGAGFRMPLWRGGRDQAALAAARLEQRGQEFALAEVETDLTALTIEAYIEVEKARELVQSAEEHEAATRAQLDRIARTVEAGLAVKYDRLQIEVRLEAARETRLVARHALETARTALNLARGAAPDAPVSTRPIVAFPLATGTLDELTADLLARHSGLQQARQRAAEARQLERWERAGHRPEATLQGSLSNYGADHPPRERGWTVTGTIEWKLFDGGWQQARVEEARQKRRQAEAAVADLERELRAALEKAWLAQESARQRLAVTRKGLELASEQMRLADIQREAGYLTVVDLLDKQAELTQARVAMIGARYDTYLSALALWRLTGRLSPDLVAAIDQAEP